MTVAIKIESNSSYNPRKQRKIRVVIPQAKREDRMSYNPDLLYREYSRNIINRLTYLTHSKEDGEDICHDAFEKLVKHWKRIDCSKIEAALGVIVHNAYCNYLVKKYNRIHAVAVDDILEFDYHDQGLMDPLRSLLNDRGMEQVQEVLQIFNEHQALVFHLFYVEEMDPRSISEQTGLVYSNVYSLLRQIRRLVNEHCHLPVDIVELEWNHSS